MSESKPNVPKLRFPGFTDPWEQRKLGELYIRSSEKNDGSFGLDKVISVASMQFNPSATASSEDYLMTYNVMRIGDIAFEGHPNSEHAFGRFVENDLGDGVVSHIFNVFRPKSEYDLSYWKYAINNERMMRQALIRSTKASTMMHDLVASDFLKQDIQVPTLPEQRLIGAFFRDLDDLIALHQRKLDDVKQLKRGMLQKMFPKDGSSVPEVRFPGFTDPWEQRKLGELYIRSSEKNDGSFGLDKVISVASMQFNPSATASSEDYLMTYNVMRIGDIAFEGHPNSEHAFGRFVENDLGDGVVSHIFNVFRPKSEYDLSYWKYAINNERMMRQALIRSTKASTMMHDLVASDFLKQDIQVPTLPEQRLIGAFFRDLDDLIALHQRELDHIKLLKKALLQQMFV